MLPISELASKVKEFGEEFPNIYLFSLKVICPFFSLFLAATAVYNEIYKKDHSKSIADNLLSYAIFLTPTGLFTLFYFWNPYPRYEKELKAEERVENLIGDDESEKEDSIF